MVTSSFLDKNVRSPQQKSVSGDVLRKSSCYRFTVRLTDQKCFASSKQLMRVDGAWKCFSKTLWKSATGITVSCLLIASAMKNFPFSPKLESVYASNPKICHRNYRFSFVYCFCDEKFSLFFEFGKCVFFKPVWRKFYGLSTSWKLFSDGSNFLLTVRHCPTFFSLWMLM